MKTAAHEAASEKDRDVREEFELARQAVADAYSSFLNARKHLKKAALAAGIELTESAGGYVEEGLSCARDKREELSETTSDYVRKNPLTSAGIAFLGGVIFSRMFGK